MNELDERLQMLYELVPMCGCVADIGTDHGLLPLALLRGGKCKKGIACDISEPSLQKAVVRSKAAGISLDCRQSDGLASLAKGEADCIVLAGMGGILISELLEKGREKLDDALLVLQPMTAVKELREYLCANRFVILSEDMVFQGRKRYHAFTARAGEPDVKYDCEIGSGLRNHPLFGLYLKTRKEEELEIICRMGAYRGEEYKRHLALAERFKKEEEFYYANSK